MAVPFKITLLGVRDSSDDPLDSGLVRTYNTGTSTPGDHLYTDNALTSAITQPYSLDSSGKAELYCSETATFRVVIKDSSDTTTIYDVDPAEGGTGVGLDSIVADTTTDNYFATGAGVTADEMWQKLLKSLNNLDTDADGLDCFFVANTAFSNVNGTNDTNAVGRKLQYMLSDVFNVRAYGATGDGTTDDATFINNALAALTTRGGGVLYFPATDANYRCASSITINNANNVTLMGDGPGSIVRLDSSSDALIEFTGTSSNCSVQNLTLWGGGTGASTASLGVAINQGAGGANNIKIHNVTFSGSAAGTGFNRAIDTDGEKVTISDCHFERIQHSSQGYAVYVNGAEVSISNCHFLCNDGSGQCDNAILAAADADRLRISNCYIEDAAGAGIELSLLTEANVTGCNVNNCGSAGILIDRSDYVAVQGCTVRSNGSSGVYLAAADYSTVQGCVIDSNTNDGVTIANVSTTPSNYCTVSSNTISQNTRDGVRITSDDGSGIPVGCVISANAISANSQNGVTAHGIDCVVAANSIAGNSTGGSGSNSGIEVGTGTGTDRDLLIAANGIYENATYAYAACVTTQGSDRAEASVLGNFLGAKPPFAGPSTWSVPNYANVQRETPGSSNKTSCMNYEVVTTTGGTYDIVTPTESGLTVICTGTGGTVRFTPLTAGTDVFDSMHEFRVANFSSGNVIVAAGGGTVYDSTGTAVCTLPTKTMGLFVSYGTEMVSVAEGT